MKKIILATLLFMLLAITTTLTTHSFISPITVASDIKIIGPINH